MAPSLGAIKLAVVSFITLAMAVIAAVLRVWSRHLRKQSLVIHDYLALAGVFFTAATVAVFVAGGFAAGLGIHVQKLAATAPEKVALYVKLFLPSRLLWAVANSCVKASILSFYTALFPNKVFIRLCYGTMFATALYLVLVLVKSFASCRPVQYTWDKAIDDACILALPMPLVFRLQMTMTRRINVAGMFSFGALICIISLLRTIWLATFDDSDLTYNGTTGNIYFVLEPTLGVVNACLPTIKPAIVKLFGPRAHTPAGRAPQVPCRPLQNVNGNFTRDIERLDDEFPLYEIRTEAGGYAESDSHSHGSNNVQVDRGFGVAHGPSAAV